jgi:lipoyl(octanoyl) transferase
MTFNIRNLPGLLQYEDALKLQEQAVEAVLNGGPQVAFFLEHPPIFTLGSGANAQTELLNPGDIPTVETGRGGKTTYHGPGQRVVYIIRDLRHRRDIRAHITDLQNWLITSLADLGVQAHTTDDVGVWVGGQGGIVPLGSSRHCEEPSPACRTATKQSPHDKPNRAEGVIASEARQSFATLSQPAKIAAIGVRVRKWVSFHGIALNVNPNLTHYQRIIPCGLNLPVTSLHALGNGATMQQVDEALANNLPRLA